MVESLERRDSIVANHLGFHEPTRPHMGDMCLSDPSSLCFSTSGLLADPQTCQASSTQVLFLLLGSSSRRYANASLAHLPASLRSFLQSLPILEAFTNPVPDLIPFHGTCCYLTHFISCLLSLPQDGMRHEGGDPAHFVHGCVSSTQNRPDPQEACVC